MAVTMDSYAPFDSGPGSSVTEDGWRDMMRYRSRSGVLRDVDNSMLVYADSTGMQVKVKTGQVEIQGHWGKISSEKTQAIATAHATLARLDLIVARLDVNNNRIEVDSVAGTAAATPVAPNLTRNSTIYEIPLAVVSVPAADTGIDASQVTDARVWGGPPTGTLADDYDLFGDKVSSLQRAQLTTTNAANNGFVYATVFRCLRDCTVTKSRFYLGTAQSGGSVVFKIFAGYHPRALADVTGASTIPINVTVSPNAIHEDTLTAPVNLLAGQYVGFAHTTTSSTTAPTLGTGSVVPASTIFNQTGTGINASVFKSGSMPSVLDTLDGSWTLRDRIPWFTLA